MAQAAPARFDDQRCLHERLGDLQQRLERQPTYPIPQWDDPVLWTEEIRWHRDADWQVGATAGAVSTGFYDFPGGRKQGWVVSAMALWEGGGDGPGLRLSYGRFGADSSAGTLLGSAGVSRMAAELVAQKILPLGADVAFMPIVGIGVERIIPTPGPPNTSGVASVDLRLAFAPVRRLDLSAGLGAALGTHSWSRPDTCSLSATLGLGIHFGDYGERRRSSAER